MDLDLGGLASPVQTCLLTYWPLGSTSHVPLLPHRSLTAPLALRLQAFHAFALFKMWSFLPANQRVHLMATGEGLLMMLVWRRLDFASFARWRDWAQAAIRLLLLLSPPMGTVWELSVGIDPPAALTSSSAPGWAVSLAMLPLVLCSMLVPHYHVFATPHSLPLWPHLLLHTLFVLCATSRLEEGCSSCFVVHPLTVRVTTQITKFCNLLSFRGMWGARAERERAWECRHVVLFLQIFGGFLASLATSVLWDASAAQEFQRHRHWQQQQQWSSHPQAHAQQRCALPDRACDALSARFLMPAAAICRRPAFWWLAAVLIWNLVVCLTPAV